MNEAPEFLIGSFLQYSQTLYRTHRLNGQGATRNFVQVQMAMYDTIAPPDRQASWQQKPSNGEKSGTKQETLAGRK